MKPYYEKDGVVIYCGDCRELGAEMIYDNVITDPPYGEWTHGNHLSKVVNRKGLGFHSIGKVELLDLVVEWVEKSTSWVVFTCEWHYMHLLDEKGLLKRFGIWVKPNGAPQFTGDRPGTGWEAVAVCHKSGKMKWNGGGKHAVWTIPRSNGGHPTAKPVRLVGEFIEQFTNQGSVVYDPFMGSGTTVVVAKLLNRKAIGIEVEERFCEIAAKQLEQTVIDFVPVKKTNRKHFFRG